jgi:Lrp/AsnC family leucine-responsive transcriptional regulator
MASLMGSSSVIEVEDQNVGPLRRTVAAAPNVERDHPFVCIQISQRGWRSEWPTPYDSSHWGSIQQGNDGMASQTQRPLDALDWSILRELQADARLSYNELARRVGLSSPTVAERVRRLEEAGVIAGYRAEVDPAKVGLPVMALVRLRCRPGRCLLNTSRAAAYPEVLEVLKVSGAHCTVLKVVAASIPHLERVFDRLRQHGEIETAVVWSSGLERRPIDWEGGVPEAATPAPEWG